MSLFASEKIKDFFMEQEEMKKIVSTPMSDLDILVCLNAVIIRGMGCKEDATTYLTIISGLVNASEKILSLVDDDTKKEHEGFIKTLITNKEKLLRYYGSHPL